MSTIAGIGISLPPSVDQDDLWSGFFARHYDSRRRALAQRIFQNSGVRSRQTAVSPLVEDVSEWSTGRRMDRYRVEAMPMGKEAIDRALADAGVRADEIGLFAVCSCTGYATPGLDILLARDLGMAPTVQRLFIGHMGCYAALPAMGAVADFVATHNRPALLLCIELTSLHLQPAAARVDIQQIVSHALFADAAAAVVLTPGDDSDAYAFRQLSALTDVTAVDHMTWDITDTGFRMGLSPQVPAVLAKHVQGFASTLGATPADGWAVHPGGPKILDVIEERLELPPDALEASRSVLAAYGNCSSPTVLMVLDALRRRDQRPARVVLMAFGPGLTLYGAVLGPNLAG
ncbi:type III polyketide synthase [Actinoplanes sp. NPDC089786]|uniref:type III polyketide synthase n=1 Tax=Actinoplanes sp. NPDC089786 TaxID=3155185 RepID=UPI0034260C9E